MAEGMLGGILGDEDENPEVEAREALAGADAFAAAVAARLSASDPEVARDTSAFLKKQAQILETQNEHLKDEHSLRLAHLRHQLREDKVRRFGLRLRVGFQLFVALAASVIGIGFIAMIGGAISSRSIVIDAFDIAPNVAAQAPSGKIVATGLLDVLARIQTASRGNMERRSLSNAWTNEISIEVPETGVSIGQLEEMIKTRFGHDQHITGDLVQSAEGIALKVRGTGIPAKTFIGDAGSLDKLLTQGGEYVFGASQPTLWVAYLTNNDRADEAIRFAQAVNNTVGATERPHLMDYWANAIVTKGGSGAAAEALPLYREALRLKPDYWAVYANIMSMLDELGDEEGAVRLGEQLRQAAGGRPGRSPEAWYVNYDAAIWDLRAARADVISELESLGGISYTLASYGDDNLFVAQMDVQTHDVDAAILRLTTTPVDPKNAINVAVATFDRALIAEATGDLKAAAVEWDAYVVRYADASTAASNPQGVCYAAVTYERTGQRAKADAALDAPGKTLGVTTFIDCTRFRGDVWDLRGDWLSAQEWYAKAVKLGPSIPSGYYSWGLALAKHGDLDGAVAKFKEANQKGPHWADPLKAWGDVLVTQGKPKDAIARYDEALKHAPNWRQLKDAREAAAKQLT